jgi:polysaccharide chain length determinant protein (PEP-CTERM system associated)
MEERLMKALSLRDLAHVVFKRRSKILVFFLAVILAVLVGTFLATPIYQAESQILVRTGRENIYTPIVTAGSSQGPVLSLNREEQINSAIEILKSPSLLEKTAESIGPSVIYSDLEKNDSSAMQAAVVKLEKALKVTGVKNSNVIEVKLRHRDPKTASMVLDELIRQYLDRHLEVYKSPHSHQFLEEQSKTLLSRLRDTEDRLNAMKKEHNVSSLDEERRLLLSQEGTLRAELDRTQSQIAETENRIVQLQKQVADTSKTIPTEVEIEHSPNQMNTLQTRLVELELKEKELLTKYTDESRLVRQVQEEIQVVRARLAEQATKQSGRSRSGPNPTHQRLQEEFYRGQADLKALKAKEEMQASQLGGYRERLGKLSEIEGQLKALERQVDVEQQNYRLYLSRIEESRISEAMDTQKISNVTQIQPARTPLKPVSPKVALNLVIGFFLAGFGSLGLAFFLEHMDDRLEKRDDTERALNLPVLASIPELKA